MQKGKTIRQGPHFGPHTASAPVNMHVVVLILALRLHIVVNCSREASDSGPSETFFSLLTMEEIQMRDQQLHHLREKMQETLDGFHSSDRQALVRCSCMTG